MDMKTSKRIPPGTPKCHRLTSENRIIIWTLKKEGKSETYIAARIGCSVSTISRGLDRNKGKKGCRHKKAQGMAQHRIAVKAARKAAEVHGQDVEALQGEAPGGLDAPDGRRALQARQHPDGVRGNALPGVLPPSGACPQGGCRRKACPRSRSAGNSARRATGTRRSTATPDAARFRGGWTSTSVPGRWRTAPAWATGRGTSSTGWAARGISRRWSSA